MRGSPHIQRNDLQELKHHQTVSVKGRVKHKIMTNHHCHFRVYKSKNLKLDKEDVHEKMPKAVISSPNSEKKQDR